MINIYPWHHTLWQRFCQQQQQQRLPHALLLTGITGLGKHHFAQAIVANILCTSLLEDFSPCGQCHSCQLLKAGNHPEHIEIIPEEPGKQIKIDQIRDLKDKQQLTSSVADWKTIIITPADSMNVNASNSLLKLLEEPQHNTLLILISNQPEQLPITIRSRCQTYHFRSPPSEQVAAWLLEKNITHPELEKILQLSHGAPIKALEILENNRHDHYKQLVQDFEALLSGQVNPVTLAASWKELELSQVLHTMQYLLKERLIEIMTTQQNKTILRYYFEISDCITNTIKLISSLNNINKTLLTEEFIVSIMKLSSQNNLNR